jgi:hypothetical protein
MTEEQLNLVRRLAAQLRVDSIRCSTQAGSGHPTSSLSAADLMAALLVGHLHYDWDQPHLAANDHLIFSKGHASPLLYSMFRAVGVVSEEELIDTYRQLGARLEGHPTPGLPWVDVATGSLGQGLPGDRRTHDRGRGPLPRGRDRQRRTAGPGHRIGAGATTRAPCRAGAAHLGHPGGTSRRSQHLRSPHRRCRTPPGRGLTNRMYQQLGATHWVPAT